jgi:hypothetical protein
MRMIAYVIHVITPTRIFALAKISRSSCYGKKFIQVFRVDTFELPTGEETKGLMAQK